MNMLNNFLDWWRRKLRRATMKGLLSTSVWQIANYIIPLITFPYLARVLGVWGFGITGMAAAITAYGLLLTDWGFALTATQEVARERNDPAAVNRIIWETIAAKSVLGIVAAGTMIAGALLFVDNGPLRTVLIVSTLNVLGSVLTVDWALRGVEAFSKFATASIIGRAIAVPLVFILVREPGDVVPAVIANATGGLSTAVLTLVMARQLSILRRPVWSPARMWRTLANGANIFLSTAMISLYTNSLTVVLGFVSGTQMVGVFSASEKIRQPVYGLLTPISMVFYPRMSFLAGSDPTRARETSRRLLFIQGGIALFLSASLCIGAPIAVRILLGPGFGASVLVLRILSWLIFLIGVSNVLGLMIMLPFGLKREFTCSLLAGVVVGVGLAFPFAGWWGAVGTAIAAVAAEAAITLVMFAVVAYRLPWFRSVLKVSIPRQSRGL
jgi:polysaccharide transporter, PST family